jgi:hypothetical protein
MLIRLFMAAWCGQASTFQTGIVRTRQAAKCMASLAICGSCAVLRAASERLINPSPGKIAAMFIGRDGIDGGGRNYDDTAWFRHPRTIMRAVVQPVTHAVLGSGYRLAAPVSACGYRRPAGVHADDAARDC